MFSWLASNIATIVLSILLAAVVFQIIRKMIKDRKDGKTACGCDCASCKGCGYPKN